MLSCHGDVVVYKLAVWHCHVVCCCSNHLLMACSRTSSLSPQRTLSVVYMSSCCDGGNYCPTSVYIHVCSATLLVWKLHSDQYFNPWSNTEQTIQIVVNCCYDYIM